MGLLKGDTRVSASSRRQFRRLGSGVDAFQVQVV